MKEKTNDKPLLQWHPAFYAGLQIEFEAEIDKLIFENEHHIGTKPKEIDVLIIKKNSEDKIQKNIGRIFRKHNIIEYKSPDDYLSIDDFYLVYAYACLYKSDSPSIDEICVNEITITFVCSKYPKKLIEHLKKIRNYRIEKVEDGVYYVKGDFFPLQIIYTKELSDTTNLWLHNLRNDIAEKHVIQKLLLEYKKHDNANLYSSVINIIATANKETFLEVTTMTTMSPVLEEIFLEVHGERLKREQQKAIDEAVEKAVQEAVEKAVQEAVEEAVQEAVEKAVEEAVSIAVAEKDAYIKELESKLAQLINS